MRIQKRGVFNMRMAIILKGIGRFLYFILVFAYPLIEKIGIAYCLFQFVLMLVYWDTPDKHPGYRFIGAFIILAVLLVLVAYEDNGKKINRGAVQQNHR